MSMGIRNAIFAAAAHIEANPGEFQFTSCATPKGPGCGTPGCALGWIKHFYGGKQDKILHFAAEVMGVGEHEMTHIDHPFYERMDQLSSGSKVLWTRDAGICATTLRAYADLYHPAWPSHPRERTQALGSWGDIAKLGWTPGVRA